VRRTNLLYSRVAQLAVACLLSACVSRRSAPQSSGADVYPEEIQSSAERRQEIDEKVARIVALLKAGGETCAALSSRADIAWITGGVRPGRIPSDPNEYVPQEVIITSDGRRFALGFGPELRRLEREELGDLGVEFRAVESMAPEARCVEVMRAGVMICGGKPRPYIGSADGSGDSTFRSPLTQAEVHKYRWLGRACAEAVERVGSGIPRFATEKGVEVLLADALRRRDIDPVQIRVSADDRLREYGLVSPGSRGKIERVVAIGLTARRWGLHVSLARTASLGPLDQMMARDLERAAALVAGLWARTVPGGALREACLFVLKGYERFGTPEIASRHPVGWTTGYGELETLVDRETMATAQTEHPLVWSVAVGSAELTDTVMLIGDTFELLTATPDWPRVEAKSLGRIYRIPSILVR
jgi:hypothetical protein